MAKTKEILNQLELSFDTFNEIMVQFQRFGFIEDLNLRHSDISFDLRTDPYDYAQKGGFRTVSHPLTHLYSLRVYPILRLRYQLLKQGNRSEP